MFRTVALASVVAMLSLKAQAQTTPTLEELAAQVKAQQAQIEALAAAAEKNNAATPFAGTTLGGYGEAHFYGNKDKQDSYDAYRFVLFIGHQFSDRVRLHSELEVEHALTRDNPAAAAPSLGEVELEQMFIEWNYAGRQHLSIGQILVPVGFLNETHEPDTFYGAKRNPVETSIVPTTWWEGGIKASGEIVAGLSYDAFVSTGLKWGGPDAAANTLSNVGDIRKARQKGAKAVADELAYTGRLRYTGVKGLELGVSYQHQTDIAQGLTAAEQPAALVEAHVGYQLAGFSARALWARWELDGLAPGAAAAEQEGHYLEAGYKPLETLGVFARYSVWDTAANDVADSEKLQWNYGVNYWLTPRAVLKLDIQEQELPTSGVDEDGFALAVGYSF